MSTQTITDFSDLSINSLGNEQKCVDCSIYEKDTASKMVKMAQVLNSYWMTVLSPNTCFDASKYDTIQVTGKGFSAASGRLSIAVKASSTGDCSSFDQVQYNDITIWQTVNGFDIGVIKLSAYSLVDIRRIRTITFEKMIPYNTAFLIKDLKLLPKVVPGSYSTRSSTTTRKTSSSSTKRTSSSSTTRTSSSSSNTTVSSSLATGSTVSPELLSDSFPLSSSPSSSSLSDNLEVTSATSNLPTAVISSNSDEGSFPETFSANPPSTLLTSTSSLYISPSSEFTESAQSTMTIETAQPLLLIVAISVTSVAIASVVLLYCCMKFRSQRKSSQRVKIEAGMGNYSSSVNLLQFQPATIPQLMNIRSKTDSDQKPIIKSPSSNDFTNMSTTMSVTFSKVISVPGFMAIDVDRDILFEDKDKSLGRGATATTVKGKWRPTNEDIAVKIFTESSGEINRQAFLHEVALMSAIPLNSPHLVKFLGYIETPSPAIVMKFYQISLREYLKKGQSIEMDLKIKIALDIALGMETLHSIGIIHLDLKPHNVLLDILSDNTFNCVICDFGLASFINDEKNPRTFVSGFKAPNLVGITIKYASPELWEIVTAGTTNRLNSRDNMKIDVYAYAVTVYEVVTGIDAWAGLNQPDIRLLVLYNQRPQWPANFNSPQLKSLVEDCWEQEPKERPQFSEIRSRLQNRAS